MTLHLRVNHSFSIQVQIFTYIVCQLKGSTVREFLLCETHPKQDRQEVDNQENITLLKRKDNSY